MEFDKEAEIVIREVLRRLGPKARLDPALLREQIAKMVKEQGEMIFAQLSDDARQRLLREGLKTKERTAHLGRINEAIEYGCSLVAGYKVERLGELPHQEQQEFARRLVNASGGVKMHEN
jgi:hypothetical protein